MTTSPTAGGKGFTSTQTVPKQAEDDNNNDDDDDDDDDDAEEEMGATLVGINRFVLMLVSKDDEAFAIVAVLLR